MKISASIFSDSEKNILTTIDNLNSYHVDVIHVDCKNRFSIFDDIKTIRENSTLPIDLHIITEKPADTSSTSASDVSTTANKSFSTTFWEHRSIQKIV